MLTIQDTILVTNPVSVDAFLSNYYVIGSNIQIDTIPEYLARIVKPLRRKGVPITWILESGLVPNNTFASFQNTHPTTKYWFKDGVEDENLVEIQDVDLGSLKNALLADEEFITNLYNLLPSDKYCIAFDYHDLTGDGDFQYTLELDADYPYKITELIIESDDVISSVNLIHDNGSSENEYVYPISDEAYDIYDVKQSYIITTNNDIPEHTRIILELTTVGTENSYITGKLRFVKN